MLEYGRNRGNLFLGILFGSLFSLGGVVVSFLLAGLPLLFIGLLQALWMVPAWLNFRNKGETETAKGIVIVAGIVFLLNASCWGLLMGGKIRFGG
jgi:hypothetical protein